MDYGALSSQALILACLDTADTLAWEEFVRRYQKLIASVVIRTSLRWGDVSSQVVDELVQETYLKLCGDDCRILRSFQSDRDEAIFGYIKVLTANLVHDHFKESRREKRGGSASTSPLTTDSLLSENCSEVKSAAQMEKRVLIQQISACVESATDGPYAFRDRQIFWLYYRAGLTAAAIASLPPIGLSIKGVETVILRLTRSVRQRLANRNEIKRPSEAPLEGIQSPESL